MAQTRSIEEILTLMAKEVPHQEGSSHITPGLGNILSSYEKIPYWSEKQSIEVTKGIRHPNSDKIYETCSGIVRHIEYTKDDIETFVNKELKDIGKEKAKLNPATGLFISTLINNLPQSEELYFQLDDVGDENRLDHLGFRLGENKRHTISIGGPTPDYVAEEMIDGRVYLPDTALTFFLGKGMKGGYIEAPNSQHYVGSDMEGGEIHLFPSSLRGLDGSLKNSTSSLVGDGMKGGKIVVEGNTHCIGDNMQDGYIRVAGNVMDRVGSGMRGGNIVVHGDVATVGLYMKGGDIVIEGNAGSLNDDGYAGRIYIGGDVREYVRDEGKTDITINGIIYAHKRPHRYTEEEMCRLHEALINVKPKG